MHSYQCPDDLKQVGVRILTGEACGLSMRILCDLDEDGIKLWETFTRSKAIVDGWNDGKASVMIPPSMFQELWIFGHVMKGTKYVFLGGHVWINEWEEESFTMAKEDGSEEVVTYRHPKKGWIPTAYATDSEEEMEKVREHIKNGYFYIARPFTKSNHPGTGLDNRHAMSGRVV